MKTPESEKTGYSIQLLPANSEWARELCEQGLKKHYIKALIELDVTKARSYVRHYRKETGINLSFFAWFVSCIADAIDRNRAVHACRCGRGKVVIFEDVDISMPIERVVDGKRMPMPYVLRSANRKSVEAIHSEIEQAKDCPLSPEDLVLSKPMSKWLLKVFPSLPKIIKNMFWSRFLNNPFFMKRITGTVGVTSVAIAGKTKGWALPISMQPICFALGSMTETLVTTKQNTPEKRDCLRVTILFDHDVIDGAPAARFISSLTKLVDQPHSVGIGSK